MRRIVEILRDRAQKEIENRVYQARRASAENTVPTTKASVSVKKGATDGVYFIASSAAAWLVMQIPALRPAEESIIEVIAIAVGAVITSGLKASRNYLKHKFGIRLEP